MRRAASLAVLLLLASGATAFAQTWELAAMGGYTPAVEFDRHAPEVEKAGIDGGLTMAFEAGWFFAPRLGVEASWSQELTAYEIGFGGETLDVHEMSVMKLHGNVVYRFSESGARLQPFVFGGLGATFFTARDVPSESKLSFGLGGGVKYFPWANVGLLGKFRFAPTMMNDDEAGDFCDAFGYCQSTIRQMDVLGGVVFRF